jgi:hypothetical protein
VIFDSLFADALSVMICVTKHLVWFGLVDSTTHFVLQKDKADRLCVRNAVVGATPTAKLSGERLVTKLPL